MKNEGIVRATGKVKKERSGEERLAKREKKSSKAAGEEGGE